MAKHYSFRDIVEARIAGDRRALNEASLGRVLQHYRQAGEKSFAIITSDRAGDRPKVKRAKRKQLEAMIRSYGLGFFKLVGHWRECQDNDVPYEKCPPHMLVDVKEMSFFVPGLTLEQSVKIAKKFSQDAWTYVGPETKGRPTIQFRHSAPYLYSKLTPNQIAQGYSTVKGRDFVFEYVVQSHAEAIIEGSMICTD